MRRKMIILLPFFLVISIFAKAQNDTTYFIFNGKLSTSKEVFSDSLCYRLKVDQTWFNMEILTKCKDIHDLVHWKRPNTFKYVTLDQLNNLKRKYTITYLSNLTGGQFIDKFDYFQYKHVYYIIPLQESDENGYKAYEFTFNSDFLDVE